MSIHQLEQLPSKQLLKIADTFGLKPTRKKKELVQSIFDRYCEIQKYISYTYVRQLGHEGKDARTFLALDSNGKEVAVKLFRQTKKSALIRQEAEFQRIGATHGISPAIIEVNPDGKYIVMEKLDTNLYDVFREQNGILTDEQKSQIRRIFRTLDKCGILHGDPNPLNFMKKENKWYIIDYGFATKSKPSDHANQVLMTLGFEIQLQRIFPSFRFA